MNVPSGPRKPMRRRAVGAASSVTRRNATGVDEAALVRLMESVRSGDVHPDDAVAELRRLPFADLGFARVDHHRSIRQGFPEVVFGPGKSPEQIAIISERIVAAGQNLLVTRTTAPIPPRFDFVPASLRLSQ